MWFIDKRAQLLKWIWYIIQTPTTNKLYMYIDTVLILRWQWKKMDPTTSCSHAVPCLDHHPEPSHVKSAIENCLWRCESMAIYLRLQLLFIAAVAQVNVEPLIQTFVAHSCPGEVCPPSTGKTKVGANAKLVWNLNGKWFSKYSGVPSIASIHMCRLSQNMLYDM